MEYASQEADNRSIRRVTYLGMVINVLLSILKVVVGSMANSIALVADGVHSISDVATDAAVLLGVRLGAKKPDFKHPYGHGRLETFSTVFVAMVLMIVGGIMIYKASVQIGRIQGGAESKLILSAGVFWVAIISIALKEALFWISKAVAFRSHSTALYANAWHHRSDALSSVAVLIGFAAVKAGYVYGDQVAAIAVGLLVILVGARIMGKSMEEFAERAVDSDTFRQITEIIESEDNIRRWHKLRTRNVGREIFVDVHILVDPELSIVEAHGITMQLEKAMNSKMARPVNITIHVEPDVPELRRK